ncbi:MAG: hypothetical protein AYK19_12100 [Theionarchaea archaeon DG-70-1]|nr:MAG: hypothetical protein AYK19_12100 [Theionarchaea archaeon DG-70-1]
MDGMITIRVRNVLGTEETDVQINDNATVGQLIQQAAPQLQISPMGATIMFQGQQLPPEQPLYKAGVGDLDTVMIAPGSIVGGGGDPLFGIAFQVATTIVAGIAANYIYDRLHRIDLKELTKRLLIGTSSRNKHLILGRIQYEKISEKVAELLYQELTDWKRINEEPGVEILDKSPPKRIQYEKISEKIAELLYQELTDWKRINEEPGVEILDKSPPKRPQDVKEMEYKVPVVGKEGAKKVSRCGECPYYYQKSEKYGYCTLRNALITEKHIACDWI